ncbi:hypothetical protein ScPMuIL_009137 [Solemya velum]
MSTLKSRSIDYTAMERDKENDMVSNGKVNVNMQTYVEKEFSQDPHPDEDESEPCGWLHFRPSIFQKFRDPKWVLFWLCWAGAVQGMVVNGFVNVNISSLERRFSLSSTESGLIASCYDIASVLCLIPISYFGGLGSKPRYLGIGIFIMGVGSFVFSLPHFMTDLYKFEQSDQDTCRTEALNDTICDINIPSERLSDYKYILYLGQLLHGAGAAPLYTLGVTYLDENLPLRSTSFYIGIYYAFAILGPAVGYLVGSEFLNIYVDIDKVDQSSVTIQSSNPRYVGAWWIGFLIAGVLALLISFPMSGFPNLLPGAAKYKAEKEQEVYKGKAGANEKVVTQKEAVTLKTVLKSAKELLFNPTFMFLNFAAATEGNLLAGLATFAPKFLELQFSLPSSKAALYIGLAAVLCGGTGTFLGGYIVKRRDMHIRSIIKYCFIVTVIVLVTALLFLLHCDQTQFAGVNVEYQHGNKQPITEGNLLKNFTADCNAGCHCSEDLYNPVCGADGVLYFSSCHAGCANVVTDGAIEKYTNCSCINSNTTETRVFEATAGNCDSTCTLLPLFMPIFSVLMLLTFLTSMPALSATLRCLPPSERSFGLGIQWIIARCLGSIPGPLLLGWLVDLSCTLWQNKCDDKGSCYFYDNKIMSYNILALCLVGKFFSALFFGLSLWLYKAPPESSAVMDASLTGCPNTPSMQTVVSTLSETTDVRPNSEKNHIT